MTMQKTKVKVARTLIAITADQQGNNSDEVISSSQFTVIVIVLIIAIIINIIMIVFNMDMMRTALTAGDVE